MTCFINPGHFGVQRLEPVLCHICGSKVIGSQAYYMDKTNPVLPQFSTLGIDKTMLAILDKLNFKTATPIQAKCIPLALAGKDLVGIAQTGTGKTLAFGLPMIHNLSENGGQGLIVLPTRELALQVDEVLRSVGGPLGLRTEVVIGGAHMDRQARALRRNPHIVVATPGRLIDHLKQRNFSLQNVKIIVLDEADRMFDIGFAPQIKQIMTQAPVERQTLLFSATMPSAVAEIAQRYMRNPQRVEVAPAGTTMESITQEVYIVGQEVKMQLLEKHLSDTKGTVLVFSRTKHGAKKYTRSIVAMGHSAVEIHSNRSLTQRRSALDGFKSGRYRVLVATDIAARGIDVNNISLVVNYDLPDNPEDYVHRIGRTGRAGLKGKAVSFVAPDQRNDIRRIERLIRKSLPVMNLPADLPARRPTIVVPRDNPFFGGQGGRGGQRNGNGGGRRFERNRSGSSSGSRRRY